MDLAGPHHRRAPPFDTPAGAPSEAAAGEARNSAAQGTAGDAGPQAPVPVPPVRSGEDSADPRAVGISAPRGPMPVAEAPLPDAPVADVPAPDAPLPDAPVPDAPLPEAPVPGAPVPEAPVPGAPLSDAPLSDAPLPGERLAHPGDAGAGPSLPATGAGPPDPGAPDPAPSPAEAVALVPFRSAWSGVRAVRQGETRPPAAPGDTEGESAAPAEPVASAAGTAAAAAHRDGSLSPLSPQDTGSVSLSPLSPEDTGSESLPPLSPEVAAAESEAARSPGESAAASEAPAAPEDLADDTATPGESGGAMRRLPALVLPAGASALPPRGRGVLGPAPPPVSGAAPALWPAFRPERAAAPSLPVERGRARRVMRRTIRHTGHAMRLSWIASVAFAAAFTALVALALIDRSVTLPDWVTARAEAQLNRGLPAGRITLDRVEVKLERGRAPEVRLKNVGLFDDRGAEMARLNEVGAGFDLSQLMRGDWVPERLSLAGAQITLRRRADGSVDLRLGDGGDGAGSLADVLGVIDRVFADGPLSRIAVIEARELTLTLQDARVGRIWQASGGQLDFIQDRRSVGISLAFDVFNGTENLARTTLSFHTEKGSAGAEIGATLSNAASGDIALQSPVLAFLGVLDAPISGALRLSLGADARLTDFAGMLEIGKGALSPGEAAPPVGIDRGKAYFTYDPDRRRIDFSDLSLASDAVAVQVSGQTFLDDLGPDGWPGSFVGQFRLQALHADAEGFLAQPLAISDGLAEFKLALNPFELRLGRLSLTDGASRIALSGRLRMTPEGPDLALDAAVDRIGRNRVLALWPPAFLPGTRDWLARNLLEGEVTDARGALRRAPGEPERLMLGFGFEGAKVRFMHTMPPLEDLHGYVSLADDRLVVRADGGRLEAPEGGTIDLAGTVFQIPDVHLHMAPAEVGMRARGPVTAVLSLLDQEPLGVMRRAGRPVALAEGDADLAARIAFPLKPHLQPGDVAYAGTGTLRDVSSDRIVAGRTLAAARLSVETDGKTLTIAGPGRFGALPLEAEWTQGIGPGAAPGKLVGTVELGEAFVREFGIELSPGAVRGRGRARIEVAMGRGSAAPGFVMTSDLSGVALRLDSIAWSKPAESKARLEVEGSFGAPPEIDRLLIDGAGLTVAGSVRLKPGGALDEARFQRLRVGGWLDSPVTLIGRGPGAQPGLVVQGGWLDFRRAAFGTGWGKGDPGGGPVTVALDRLTVADGIALTDFRGEFSTRGGFGGKFSARLNGGGEVNGTAAHQNGGTALRVVSENAGDVLRDANLAQRIRGGAMELILLPTGRTGTYDGSLTARNVRVRGTPALAELLNAVSIVGILQQLNGDGLVFDQVETRFRLTPDAIDFTEGSAIGASLGISASGSYALGSGALDIRGVFSPIYLLNGIGQIFGRKGEGLFGFNYRVRGTAEDPKVSVNPLSILTPGMFREIFRALPPAER